MTGSFRTILIFLLFQVFVLRVQADKTISMEEFAGILLGDSFATQAPECKRILRAFAGCDISIDGYDFDLDT